jgi:hypothetical protein
MNPIWSLVSKSKNRQILSWAGGGLVAVAAGAWAVVVYLWPAHEATRTACAQQGSIVAGRDASGNTITYNSGSVGAASGASASCDDTTKK